MSNLWPFIFVAFVLALSGALISLVALLAPVRRLARRSSIARITTLVVLALMSLALGFGFWTRLSAEAVYAFSTFVVVDTFDPRTSSVIWPHEENKLAIVNELWIRLLVPPPLRQTCYTDDADVCSMVNDLPPHAGANWSWMGYLRDISIGSVSVLTCTGIAWRFTGRRQSLPPAT